MKIASWNVNSLRVRLPHVLEWLEQQKPDVLALQETKTIDKDFPLEALQNAGYHVVFKGQPTYNGVALLSRFPLQDVVFDDAFGCEAQCRIVAATVNDIRIVNVYVPNGSAVGSDKYAFKLAWFERLHQALSQELTKYPSMVVLGDFNVAPEDRDVHDPIRWQGQVLVSDLERQNLQNILNLGFEDVFRRFPQPEKIFSWWDYRMLGFKRNHGLRIDLILASSALAQRCQSSEIDKEPRKLERPSDHAPVIAVFT